jgi:hypothetical protein
MLWLDGHGRSACTPWRGAFLYASSLLRGDGTTGRLMSEARHNMEHRLARRLAARFAKRQPGWDGIYVPVI